MTRGLKAAQGEVSQLGEQSARRRQVTRRFKSCLPLCPYRDKHETGIPSTVFGAAVRRPAASEGSLAAPYKTLATTRGGFDSRRPISGLRRNITSYSLCPAGRRGTAGAPEGRTRALIPGAGGSDSLRSHFTRDRSINMNFERRTAWQK